MYVIFIISFLVVEIYGSVSVIGVPPSKLLLYQPNKDFTCFDGSKNIPFNSVNDDFCDCADGSDEPGTSACASSIFFCPNKGYYPANIPSSRVNDGICDCCDGSDEYILKNCSDVCEILGAQALAEAERVAELMNRGNSLRLQMSSAGKQTRQQKQERLIELSKELGEAGKIKNEAEEIKNNAEVKENAALEVYRAIEEKAKEAAAEKEKEEQAEEAKAIFMEMDTDGNALLVPEEIFMKLKPLKSSQAKSDANLEEEIKFMMNSKTELSFDDFMDGPWNHIRSLLAMDDTPEPSSDNVQGNDNNAEQEHQDEGEEIEDDVHEAEDPEDDKEHEGEVQEQYGPQPPPVTNVEYDEETKRLIDEGNKARQHLEEAERSYKDLERDISGLKEFLEKDFGPDDEFLSLEGQCFSYSDREYTYKLCPFDQVVQSSKQGGSETRLGTWKSWETSGDYDTMIYDRGQSCWNGPQRSAKVHLTCGLDNEVFGASEPNKCEYVLDFRTPAACRPPHKQPKDNIIRDEL